MVLKRTLEDKAKPDEDQGEIEQKKSPLQKIEAEIKEIDRELTLWQMRILPDDSKKNLEKHIELYQKGKNEKMAGSVIKDFKRYLNNDKLARSEAIKLKEQLNVFENKLMEEFASDKDQQEAKRLLEIISSIKEEFENLSLVKEKL